MLRFQGKTELERSALELVLTYRVRVIDFLCARHAAAGLISRREEMETS